MEERKKAVTENPCFLRLDELSKEKITNAIKIKEWKFEINGKTVKLSHWHELMKNAGITQIYEKLYTHLSLATHPSNVSVFQFGESGGKPEQCIMPVQVSHAIFIAFLIRDFCTYFLLQPLHLKNIPIHIINTLLICIIMLFARLGYILNE